MTKTQANHLVTAIAIKGGKFSVAFMLEGNWKAFGTPYDTFEEADKIAKAKGNESHGENEYISMR